MPERMSTAALLVLVALVAFAPIAGVAGAAGAAGTLQDAQDDNSDEATETANASTGAQLATVIQVTDEEVRHEVEVSAFEAELDQDNETARANAIARASVELRNRSATIVGDYETATEAYESGDLSRAQYGQRLAVLHARANAVLNGFDRVEAAADETSSVELASAGYNASANAEAREQLRSVTGSGSAALFAQFTGQSSGEFSVETENGLEIEVESEDGERSREYERDEPEHGTFDVTRNEARATAEAALSTPGDDGSWILQSIERDDDGYYSFGFVYDGDAVTGEAEIGVDARSNAVFSLEEKIEQRESDDDDDDGTTIESEGSLSVEFVDGEPAPGATVTMRVTDDAGDPVADAQVSVEGGPNGTTDENGTITLTLPERNQIDIDVESGEDEGEVEIEFGDDGDDDRDGVLSIDVVEGEPEPGATVTIQVTDRSGEPVADADVRVDYEHAGTTDANGTLAVTIPGKDDVSIDVESGEAEGELDLEFDQNYEAEGAVTVDAQYADGTATVSTTFQGEPVSDADVYVEDERVGATSDDGSVSFDAAAGEDYDVVLVRGALQVEFDVEVSTAGEISADEPDWEIDHDDSEYEDDSESDDDDDSDADDDDADENETDDDSDGDSTGSLSVEVTSGDVERNGTVTVLVTDENGDPVSGATVEVDSDEVGQTDADGTITVQLPDDDDARIEAETDDLSARIDLELESGD